MRSPLPAIAFCAMAACATVTSVATAQAIHLPPVYRVTLHRDTTVMTIKLKRTENPRFVNSTLNVHDGSLIINTPGKGSEVVALGNRTIGDVVNELQSRYRDDLEISSNYPLYQARLLSGNDSLRLLTQAGADLKASPDAPAVALGFGVVMSMTDQGAGEGSGLLSQTGFQLDLVGMHQLVNQGATVPVLKQLGGPAVYVQGRLGLNADQPLAVDKQTETSLNPDAAGQFEAALEQADQVALTAQADLVWPFGKVPAHTEFSLSFGYGVRWTQPEPFTFPLIQVGDSLAAGEGLFDTARREQVQEVLDRAVPLMDYSAIALFRFRHGDRPIFYIGGGPIRQDVLRRGIRFSRDSAGEPIPTSLQPLVDSPNDWFWRAIFGARIAGLIDVRLDAIGPVGKRNSEPLLRIVLGRDFPIIR